MVITYFAFIIKINFYCFFVNFKLSKYKYYIQKEVSFYFWVTTTSRKFL